MYLNAFRRWIFDFQRINFDLLFVGIRLPAILKARIYCRYNSWISAIEAHLRLVGDAILTSRKTFDRLSGLRIIYSGIPALRRALSRRSWYAGSLYLWMTDFLARSNENLGSNLSTSAV